MNCPACGRQGTVRWTPPTYSCSMCEHVLTKREYEHAIRGGQPRDDVALIADLRQRIEHLESALRVATLAMRAATEQQEASQAKRT